MKYDFDKLAKYLDRYGRKLYIKDDGTVIFQSWEIPEGTPIKILEPDEDGIWVVTDKSGNWLCTFRKYPSVDEFWKRVENALAELEKEEALAMVIENCGIR